MDTNKKNRELISAFADGEVAEADQELALAALDAPEGQQAWALFHQIGDTLRTLPAPELSAGFSARLAERLAAEPLPGKRAVAATEAAGTAVLTAGPR